MELYKQKYYDALNNVNEVMLSATPLYSKINNDHDYEMDVLIQIMSGKLPLSYPRKDINLCIVLDRSGSMSTAIDSCKDAIKYIIESLNENDIINLIAYDDKVETVFKGCNVKDHNDLMLNKLIGLRERGSTNLYEGVNAGLDILLNDDNSGKMKILFLFSDGLANYGITNNEKIGKMIYDKSGKNDIFISTFGIGNDYDDVLMSSIAYCGNGNYFYIQGSSSIPNIVGKGLNSLTKHWTKDASLILTPSNDVTITDNSEMSFDKFKIREYALHRYLIKAKCKTDNASIICTLEYTDFEGTHRTKQVECMWEYENNLDIKLVPDNHVRCYKVIKECSEINNQIMKLMDDETIMDVIKIKELKNKIIELYKGVVSDDEYGIISMLLTKEQDALDAMNVKGMNSGQTIKLCGYATMSTGQNAKMCDYVNKKKNGKSCLSSKDDADIGFSSLM